MSRDESRVDAEREFEKLYRESYEMVYNYVRYRMSSVEEAEDVVAEAYLRAARAFSRFDPARAKFSTWMVTIATNCMRDHWRRARPSASIDDVPDDLFSQPDATGKTDDRDLVDRLLAKLSEEERTLVVMKYREDMRNVDIASALSMNASTVSTKLTNAIAKMRSVYTSWQQADR